MDGWMDGWIEIWMDGWEYGWMEIWMDGWIDRRMDGLIHGWMDGWHTQVWLRQTLQNKKVTFNILHQSLFALVNINSARVCLSGAVSLCKAFAAASESTGA